MGKWSKEWMQYIDGSKLTPYPIQLDNCDRLENNDAVYIFDEVGSGKTISSGLMALHYLYNHREEAEKQRQEWEQTVLVITTDPVKKSKQFEYDWVGKLPFGELGFYVWPERRGANNSAYWLQVTQSRLKEPPHSNILVCNHLHSDLKYVDPTHRYGLVIIDEAQTFLKSKSRGMSQYDEALQYKDLTERVWAEKVVFLTATPFRENSYADLSRYVELAELITTKPDERKNLLTKDYQSWQRNTIKKKADKLVQTLTAGTGEDDNAVCARFDPASPVTRYFKDTFRALHGIEGKKEEGVRALAHVWYYQNEADREEQKKTVMRQKIEEALTEDPSSRFIVFVRFKNDPNPQGAPAIGEFLKGKGWGEWPSENPDSRNKSRYYYTIVTGGEGDLSDFQGEKGCDDLPHVLIMTYQMGETGVNLPGFNYVVNYHIPGNPAALEQRFGRVDRLKGQHHPKIHMCYLVNSVYDGSDVNSRNFHNAQTLYMQDTLTVLPARNILITKEVLKQYRDNRKLHNDARAHISRKIDDDQQLRALLAGEENKVDPILWSFVTNIDDICKKLQSIQCKYLTLEERIKKLREFLRDAVEKQFKPSADDTTLNRYAETLQDAEADGIFYNNIGKKLCTMSPEDCAGKISGSDKYIAYQEELRPYLALPELLGKKSTPSSFGTLLCRLELYYAHLLKNGRIAEILGYDPLRRSVGSQAGTDYPAVHDYGVWPDFHRISKDKELAYLSSMQLSPEECDLLNENVGIVKGKLPFSLLCDVLANLELRREKEEDDDSWRERLFRNVFEKMLSLAERSGIESQGSYSGDPIAYLGSWWPTPKFDTQFEFCLSHFWRYTNYFGLHMNIDWSQAWDWKRLLEQLYDHLRNRSDRSLSCDTPPLGGNRWNSPNFT